MGVLGPYLELTKPRVVVLLQITALCAVLVHDMLDSGLSTTSGETMLIVFVGGYLSAGGANAVNMWYDRDIDPKMSRTAARPVPSGAVPANAALGFGIALSMLGVAWFVLLANQVAAFWSAFSILFYVFVYSIWLKRRTPQNIVIGGIAGSTPPVIGWAAAEGDLSLATNSLDSLIGSVLDLGSLMPWFMFLLIFLWTPPHFWALALYRSKEYGSAGIPMMPNVKGGERTIREMKIYALLLNTQTFHEVDEFDFLLYRRIACTGALQTVAQGLVVEPQLVRVPRLVTLDFVVYLVPIVNQVLLIHCLTSLYDAVPMARSVFEAIGEFRPSSESRCERWPPVLELRPPTLLPGRNSR